jgi:NADH-quinone oxidoreductase subunit H
MKKTLLVWTVIAVLVGVLFAVAFVGYGGAWWFEAGLPFFGHHLFWSTGWPGWIVNLLVLILGFVMIIATVLTMAERKWSAMIQDRIGPNRARIGLPGLKNNSLGGLPHIISDSVKMLTKEDFRPKRADPLLFNLGPILAFAPVLALFAVIPAGPELAIGGHRISAQIANPDFGLLWVLAIASLAVYGTSLAGWASNNKFALLGGVRACSQMISYEVALGLGLIGMMLTFATVRLPDLVAGQERFLWGNSEQGWLNIGVPAWGIFLQPVGFLCFFAAAFAETKRAPFDVPEGESEIIGYFVEYSGMKFGLFMISEFAEVVILSAITTLVFFGGWHLPSWDQTLAAGLADLQRSWGIFGAIVAGAIYATIFWVKVVLLCYVQLAIRWTFPRFRYDQIQTLGWKILLPLGLLNVFVTGALVLIDPSLHSLAILGLLEIGFILALTIRPKAATSAHDPDAGQGAGDHGTHLSGAAASSHH